MSLAKRPEVERFLAGLPPGVRAALIHGRDRGGVRERADALAARVTARPDDPFDAALLTETDLDADPARLSDELAALSMLGGRRLVRVRLDGKAGPEKLAAEALKTHADGALNPAAFLLIEAQALDRGSALRKAAEAHPAAAAIAVYEDEGGDVARMAREALKTDGVGLTAEALELFVARLPKERGVARAEIERLVLWLGPGSGATAGPDELEAFLGVEPDASLSDAAADAFSGRLRAAFTALRRAQAEGEGGVAAVRALSSHAQKLHRALVLVAGGRAPQEAAKMSGVFWKAEREFLRQLARWRLEDLDALRPEILDCDRACKSAGAPDGLLAERMAMTVAGRARRLGL